MPQFAWANDPAAVEEVMTFILGLTGERIDARYLPKTSYTPDQRGGPGGRCSIATTARAAMSSRCPSSSSAGTKWPRRSPDFKSNVRTSYTARNNDYLTELYPA